MLAALITLLVGVGTLGLLLNVLLTLAYFGSAPRGDGAVGLVIPIVISFVAGLSLTLASLLCAFNRGSSVLRLIHNSPFLTGCITIFVTFGVVLAAFMAFACWCESGTFASRGSLIIPILGWIGGIIGPILLAVALLAIAWMSNDTLLARPDLLRPIKAMFICLALIACLGYAIGGIAFYQTMGRQVANRATTIARRLRAQLPIGTPKAELLAQDLATLPVDAPLSSVVMYFPARPDLPEWPKLNNACRLLLINRVLKVPDLDNDMLVTVASKTFSDRQGVAEFLVYVPMEKLRENQEAWGQALQLAIETDADSISCRPGWLTETFDGKPDPIGHIRSLLSAAQRFKGLSVDNRLAIAMQTLTNATMELNRNDKKLKPLLRMLDQAGYQPDFSLGRKLPIPMRTYP